MAKGDHLYYAIQFPYSHHGIDCGDSFVIEFTKDNSNFTVKKTKLCHFYAKGNGKVTVKQYGKCDLPEVVVNRAKKLLGQNNYNLFTNNCEHLASYCKTGIKHSQQVKNSVHTPIAPAVAYGVKIPMNMAVKTAEKAALQSINPISKTLVKMGLKQAPKVAGKTLTGIATAGSLVTSVATDYVIGKVLEDGEHLPDNERDARNAGRNAGYVGSTVGAIGATAVSAIIGGTTAIIASAVIAPVILGAGGAYIAYQLNKDNSD